MMLSTHTGLGLERQGMFRSTERISKEETDNFDDEMQSDGNGPVEVSEGLQSVALIDNRTLRRECLRRSLVSQRISWVVAGYGSVEEWSTSEDLHPPLAAIVFHLGAQKATDAADQIKKIVSSAGALPVIVLADSDDIVQIVSALDYGVRGYIPSSVSIEVCVEAINLALAGGVYVPASSVFAIRQSITSDTSRNSRLVELFTPRQIKVADAIRQGKPNKIIAYELNMCESTVKVHIRNIMQKLKATNRTEIAYKIRDLFPSDTA
ncbi:LuxR C-terminal-related transcriptional regulator [Chelativorans salis]|uniref:Response regulator transcription factor n=1 Tax=Chelativorans salis TaxID=2978478 RepID=A0ABT2LM16_9HYPH|nr:response regulator transcription factor [Chelativorans sp. EGI FJ00035]MCT7375563.1 response regulator transcription factor [Chelativorans sp. EGI FJ00035]